MTIDRGWVEIWKSESPEAFTPTPPFQARVAYLDGMTMLMASQSTRRWDDLIRWNFCNAIQRFYRLGIKTVVLAFDDYNHVPKAKAITQANRTKQAKAEDFTFAERDKLETVIPTDYAARIRNRAYKRRVIDLVNETIMDHMKLAAGQTFIIDYTGCPVQFQLDPETREVKHTYMVNIPPCGEADIKWTRWGRLYGDIIASSTDGDFIPIALIEHEKQVAELGGESDPVQMAIFRLEFRMSEDKPKKEPADKKRKRDGQGVQGQIGAGGAVLDPRRAAGGVEEVVAEKKKGRSMEYVNITLLYQTLRDAMRQCAPGDTAPASYTSQYMRIIACLVGMTGTDFTRKLPHLSPQRVWEILSVPRVWPGLMRSYSPDARCLVTGDACDHFVAHLYTDKFCRHARGETLEEVIASVHASKLGAKTKKIMPSLAQVEVTMRNINWLLCYWECRQPLRAARPETPEEKKNGNAWVYDHVYPDPIQDQYGFKPSSDRKCAVKWLDAP